MNLRRTLWKIALFNGSLKLLGINFQPFRHQSAGCDLSDVLHSLSALVLLINGDQRIGLEIDTHGRTVSRGCHAADLCSRQDRTVYRIILL